MGVTPDIDKCNKFSAIIFRYYGRPPYAKQLIAETSDAFTAAVHACFPVVAKWGSKLAELYIQHEDQGQLPIPLGEGSQSLSNIDTETAIALNSLHTLSRAVHKAAGRLDPTVPAEENPLVYTAPIHAIHNIMQLQQQMAQNTQGWYQSAAAREHQNHPFRA